MSTFVPTHRVPSTGMDSWPQPDPSASAGPRIGGGLDVQVVDRLGDWAKVTFDNGWTAWVDGRLLVARVGAAPAARPTPAAAGAFDLQAILADRKKAFAGGGALLVLLSSVLPWFRTGGSKSSFGIPIKFLFDYKLPTFNGPKIGWLLLALAVAVVVTVVKNADERIVTGSGILATAIAVVYVIQLQRAVSATPGASLPDFIGIGAVLAAAGGLLVAFAAKLGAKAR